MKRVVAMLMVASLAAVCVAQTPAAVNPDHLRKLVEQKVRLLDMLLNSPAAKANAAARDAESSQLMEKGRKSFADARLAISDGRLDDASRLLDETLKATSAASRKISADGSGLSESALRQTLADKLEQVMTYRASLVDLTRDGKLGVQARQLLLHIDVLLGESKQLADGARLNEANNKMAAAYKLSVEEITRLRAGQEVVISLTFETPVEEYIYEIKRFSSNLTLVDMMVAEGRADSSRRTRVDGFVSEGQRIKAQAQLQADAAQHKDAVALMEQANLQLNRALQALGLAVF